MAPELEHRFERVLRLSSGTVDGGDVLTTNERVFIGKSTRTNADGAVALTALLAELGLRGAPVDTPAGVLHFKSDCSLLDDETVLSTARLAGSRVFEGLRVVIAPEGEERAANAVRVNDRVLLSADFPRTADMLTQLGYKLVALSTREIAKIDAGLSCLSLRWRA
jgi:dimethylargininase